MAKLGKKPLVALIFLLILLGSVGIAAAQSSKPTTPQFTLKLQVNNSIRITIENQPFNTSNTVNALELFYRVKDHDKQIWTEDRDYVLQSGSESTVIPVELDVLKYMLHLENTSVLDFQVQAITGYYAVTNKSGPPALISPAPQNWHTEITFNDSEYSGWSSTETITLPTAISSAVVDPTAQPTIPELQLATVLTLLAALTAVAIVVRSKTEREFA